MLGYKPKIEGDLIPFDSLGRYITAMNDSHNQVYREKGEYTCQEDYTARSRVRSVTRCMMDLTDEQRNQLSHVVTFDFPLDVSGQEARTQAEPVIISVAALFSGEYVTHEDTDDMFPRERLYYISSAGTETYQFTDRWGNSLFRHFTYRIGWDAFHSILNENRIHMTVWRYGDDDRPEKITAPQFYDLSSALQMPQDADMTDCITIPGEELSKARAQAVEDVNHETGADQVPDVNIDYCCMEHITELAASRARRMTVPELVEYAVHHPKRVPGVPTLWGGSLSSGRGTTMKDAEDGHNRIFDYTDSKGRRRTVVDVRTVQETAYGQNSLESLRKYALSAVWDGAYWLPSNIEDKREQQATQ